MTTYTLFEKYIVCILPQEIQKTQQCVEKSATERRMCIPQRWKNNDIFRFGEEVRHEKTQIDAHRPAGYLWLAAD